MAIQKSMEARDRNPRSIDEARHFVAHVESLFMPWDIDGLVNGFTDDCVVRFGTFPEFKGKEALRDFFTARMSRQKGYRLKKELRALDGNVMANVWRGDWEDAATGVKMRGYGVETWTLEGGKISIWEAAFNVGPADAPAGLSNIV